MKKLLTLVSLLVFASLLLTACGGGGGAKSADMLADIQKRGYILVSTDPNYAPQSFLNTEGKRPADTKCPSDTLTTAEMQGFDVDVAIAIGDSLGVETCFATPDWDSITAGNWANKWDVSVGSMGIKPSRAKVVDFSVPYYYTPAIVAVGKDSGITSFDQLAGTTLCVAVASTYEDWLNGKIDSDPKYIYKQPPANVTVISLPTDQECAQAIAVGRKDFVGYATSETVVDANLAENMPVVKLEGAAFTDACAAAFDRASSLDTTSLRAKVDELFTKMHTDGSLTALSMKWFAKDWTNPPK
jgi:polar amino acid transport system substrate-binding protein